MSRSVRVSAVVTLLLTAACVQSPARIDLKGQNTYGRSGGSENSYAYAKPTTSRPSPIYTASNNSSYSEPAPRYNVSSETEQTASVQSIGVSDLAPPDKSSVHANNDLEPAAGNSWTKKSRNDKPVAKLEEKKSADFGKPVRLITGKEQTSSYIWPVTGKKVLSGYGPKGSGKVNDGINIASAEGEPVWAAADGEVVYVGNELQGYGNMVLIKHTGNKTTTYAHLNRATVDKYDRIKQGDIIGYVGSTGNVKESQLHFAVRDGKNPVDPNTYLSRSVAGL